MASRSADSSSRRLSRFRATAAADFSARRRRQAPAQGGSERATQSSAASAAPAKKSASASEISRQLPPGRAQTGARGGSGGPRSARIIGASVADGGALATLWWQKRPTCRPHSMSDNGYWPTGGVRLGHPHYSGPAVDARDEGSRRAGSAPAASSSVRPRCGRARRGAVKTPGVSAFALHRVARGGRPGLAVRLLMKLRRGGPRRASAA